jgi:hypothetical protein
MASIVTSSGRMIMEMIATPDQHCPCSSQECFRQVNYDQPQHLAAKPPQNIHFPELCGIAYCT